MNARDAEREKVKAKPSYVERHFTVAGGWKHGRPQAARGCAAPAPLRWRVSNPPDVSLICRVAFRSYVFTHDVVSGNGSVRRGAEHWKSPSTEGLLLLLRVGLAISLVTSHLSRSGVQFRVG